MWCQRLGSCQLKPAHQHSIPLSSSVLLFYYVDPTRLVSRWLWSRRRDPLSTQAPIDPGRDAWCWPKTQSPQNNYRINICACCFASTVTFRVWGKITPENGFLSVFLVMPAVKNKQFSRVKKGHRLRFLICVQVGAESDAVWIIWLTGRIKKQDMWPNKHPETAICLQQQVPNTDTPSGIFLVCSRVGWDQTVRSG